MIIKLHAFRVIKFTLLLAVLLYILVCGYLWATQKELIFEPTPKWLSTPARMGLDYQEFHIPSGIGKEHGDLDAWWVPAAHSGGSPTLLYLHGNDRNISSNLSHIQRLHDLGYNIFLTDYRGFGKSTGGQPSEQKVYEDAEASWQYLVKQGGIKPQNIFIYGHSLGGAIAIELATHHAEAAGVVAESTFTSMQAMGKEQYPYLPVDWLLNQRFDTVQKIPQLKIPLLIVHGTWDKLVPVRMAQELYAAAPQPKLLVLIEGGGHGNSGTIGWVEYRDALNNFIEKNQH